MIRNGVVSLGSGTALAQAFGFVASLVLARLYSPAEFGLFSIVLGIVTVIGTISSLRFEWAIPLPDSEEKAQSLVWAGILSSITVCSLLATVVLLFRGQIRQLFNVHAADWWLWFVPPLSLLLNVTLVLTQLAIRHRRFRSVAVRSVVQILAMSAIQVGLGLMASARAWGLMLGLGCGYVIGAVALSSGSSLWTNASRRARRWAQVKVAMRRYIRFPLLLAPSTLLNTLGLQAPMLLFAHFYGPEVAGWLGLTQRVLALPLTLIGTAIAQVYQSELARAARANMHHAAALFRRSTRLLLIAGAAVAAVMLVGGPTIFSIFLGHTWHESGVYARVMSLGLAAQMVASPLAQTLIVLERVWLQFGWDLFRVLCVGGVIVLTHMMGLGVVESLWWLTLVTCSCYILSWILSFRTIRGAVASPPADGLMAQQS